MKRYFLVTTMLLIAVSGCDERNAMAPDLGLVDVNPRTVEVLIPYEDFVADLQVIGGFGSAANLKRGIIALDVGGRNVRTLIPLPEVPTSLAVPGADGVIRTDSDLSFVGGRVVLSFDTIDGDFDIPVPVQLFDVREDWHVPTVTWEAAVDTAGERRLWAQPGGGINTLLGSDTYDAYAGQAVDPTLGLNSTLNIDIDSVAAESLGDPAAGRTGLMLAAAGAGSTLNVIAAGIVLSVVPSTRPDTVIDVSLVSDSLTFIVDPIASVPAGWLRVGGAPAWRSILKVSVPRMVGGPADICGSVGCQVDLADVEINLAELLLTSRQSESAFQPRDTSGMGVRQVINPDLLPKAPLGPPLVASPAVLPPEIFSTSTGSLVRVRLTGFVRSLLLAAVGSESVPDATLALFDSREPSMIGFASFEGAGNPTAPALRLLYTVANDVGLP